FIQHHAGHIILFGDLNEVRYEGERYGTSFSNNDDHIFNSFIHDVGLIDLPLKAPEALINLLESLYASFFWGASGDKKKIAWIKWYNILASHDKRGLGVGSLKAFNMSLLLKWRWRLLNHPYALWVKVVKAIHGEEVGFELLGSQSSGVWARIVGDVPLCSRFNRLFHLDRNKDCLVKYRYANGDWSWDWNRHIYGGRVPDDLNTLFIPQFNQLVYIH
nr:reverse transcriptase domain, reverse transcriptase zinc-binding domain protein [Tanacetum cinerariifolium]